MNIVAILEAIPHISRHVLPLSFDGICRSENDKCGRKTSSSEIMEVPAEARDELLLELSDEYPYPLAIPTMEESTIRAPQFFQCTSSNVVIAEEPSLSSLALSFLSPK